MTQEEQKLVEIRPSVWQAVNRAHTPPSNYSAQDADECLFGAVSESCGVEKSYHPTSGDQLDEYGIPRNQDDSVDTVESAKAMPRPLSEQPNTSNRSLLRHNSDRSREEPLFSGQAEISFEDEINAFLRTDDEIAVKALGGPFDEGTDTTFVDDTQSRPCEGRNVSESEESVKASKSKRRGNEHSRNAKPAAQESHPSAGRSLRPRTEKQDYPYTHSQAEHNLAMRGQATTEDNIQREMDRRAKAARKRAQNRGKKCQRKKARHSSSDRDSMPSSTLAPSTATTWTQLEEFTKSEITQTVIQSRFASIFKGCIPISLAKLKENTAAELLKTIQARWQRRLMGAAVDHFIVSFPWLKDRGADANIILEGDENEDGYQDMLRKIESAPTWSDNPPYCEVYVDGILEE